jgi:HAMP domain-containing protein
MDAMLAYDYGTMERYVVRSPKTGTSSPVRIVRSDGEILAESRGKLEGVKALQETYPIKIGESSPLGVVEVVFSVERIDVLSRNIIILSAVFILAIHIIALAVNNAIINSLVIRPIGALIDITRGVKEGRLKDRIEMRQGNEFGELASAFNEMAASLDKNFCDLVNSRKEIQTEKNKLATIVQSCEAVCERRRRFDRIVQQSRGGDLRIFRARSHGAAFRKGFQDERVHGRVRPA